MSEEGEEARLEELVGSLKVNDSDAGEEAVCVYWLTRSCKHGLAPDMWMPLLQHMCKDCDVLLLTEVDRDDDWSKMAGGMTRLLEEVLTESVWSSLEVRESVASGTKGRWHVVFYRDTVTIPEWGTSDGALVVTVARRGRHVRVRVITEEGAGEGGGERVGAGEALLASKPVARPGRELLAAVGGRTEESVKVSDDDDVSEASFVRVDVSKAHESTRLADEAHCPIRAVLRTRAAEVAQ
jgi:hypothetical protein